MTDIAIGDCDELATTPARVLALDCLVAGIEAALPDRAIREAVELDGDRLRVDDEAFDLGEFDELLVLGGGKAGAGMVTALVDLLGDRIDEGCVVTDEGTGGTARAEGSGGDAGGDGEAADAGPVAVVEAAHPIPDERGIEGARRVLELADAAGERTLVLAVLSGGGSALLPAPADGIDLADLRAVTDALLDSGASIDEVNAVRKHCSAIKGGLLARRAAPATVCTLAISDVVGDDPAVIASGPTVPDPTTYADARDVLERYGIEPPKSIADHLAAGDRGEVPETPGPGDPAFDRTSYHLLATGRTAVDAAREVAEDRGYRTLVLSSRVRGEAREAAKTHAAVAEEVLATGDPVAPPAVVLSGGEVTVTVEGDGWGGPNAEFALSAGIEFAGDATVSRECEVVLACVDTDGRDGPGGDGGDDHAGALVDGATVDDLPAARRALARNDAATYLDARDTLVRTGPTGTNVNDLRVLVIPAGE